MHAFLRSKRLLIIVVCVAVGTGAGLGLALYRQKAQQMQSANIPGFLWPAAKTMAPFSLQDQYAKPFDLARMSGKWSFLFFGYTSCPDICPMTMAVMDKVSDLLRSRAPEDEIQFILVSVDPDRDTSARLRDYVAYFNDDFIGVTGSHERLRALTAQLGIMHMQGAPIEGDNYLVEHTASILLVSPDLKLIGIFSAPHDPRDIAERSERMIRFVERT